MLGSASVASAGEPADKACVGESLSVLATTQPLPGAFGEAVVSFAKEPSSPPGLGEGIQDLQAGEIPDDLVPNTCNG